MKEKFTSLGSVVSSFFAAICWLGSVILVPLGLGGLSSVLAASLAKYRQLFIVVAVLMLGLSHYFLYKKPQPSKLNKVLVWVSTLVTIGILVYTLKNG